MDLDKFLDRVAYIAPSEISGDESPTYYSKFDNSYMALVSMKEKLQWLAEKEITEELTHGVGFSPKENKWWGWSHRAAFGFTVGSECKKGDCAYVASTPEELIEDRYNFFLDISEECAQKHKDECQILEDRTGIRILTTPVKMRVARGADCIVDALGNEKTLESLLEESVFKDDFHIVKCGRGEWVAETLDDAKLMAIDFNESVS